MGAVGGVVSPVVSFVFGYGLIQVGWQGVSVRQPRRVATRLELGELVQYGL